MLKNQHQPKKIRKSFFYKLVLFFLALLIIATLQMFQMYFTDWFIKGKQIIDTDKLFSINKHFSVIDKKFGFVELIHKIFNKQLLLPKIKIIFYSIISLLLFCIGLFYGFVNDKIFKLILLFILIGGFSNLISGIRNDAKVLDYFTLNFLSKKIHFNIEDVFVIFGILMFVIYLPVGSFSQGRDSHSINPTKPSIPTSTT